jgi:polar amino acid transport system substrate-binding protein
VFSDWAPEEFVEGGQVKGWSVDLAKAMVGSLGMTVKYEATGFENIIPGLSNGRYSAAVASLGVTPERLKTVDFVPLQKEGTAFAWKKGNAVTIKAVKDACGKTVAVLTGAFEFQYLTAQNASVCGSNQMKIQQFKDQPSAELAVTSGRVDLVAAGSGKLKYTAKQGGQLEVSDLLINAIYNGIGLPKGSKLGPALKAALQAAIDDGTYAKIRADWGATSKGDLTKAVLITESNPEG